MTRTESRHWKMELLRYMSQDMHLVTGSETGHDAAVPYVHYFEGMLSLGPYRVPDAGRNMQRDLGRGARRSSPSSRSATSTACRCGNWSTTTASWPNGTGATTTTSCRPCGTKRDLFNALYGTPPMFMFNRDFWEKNKDRFVQSYQNTCPVARATGYAEMTDHRFLTPDRAVQQTHFANGVTVTVNFGDKPFRLPDGSELAPMGHRVTGI